MDRLAAQPLEGDHPGAQGIEVDQQLVPQTAATVTLFKVSQERRCDRGLGREGRQPPSSNSLRVTKR
jgi:hypothetical protein